MTRENFFPTESNIYDALVSNNRKVNEKYIVSKSKTKGIYICEQEDREKLIKDYSELILGYHDFIEMMDYIQVKSRAEKISEFNFNIEHSKKDYSIKEILEDYKKKNDNPEIKLQVIKDPESEKYTIDIEHVEVDYSKTKMIQKKYKESKIEVMQIDNNISFRHTANEFTKEQANIIFDLFKAKEEDPITKEEIDFGDISDKTILTTFFTKLYDNIDNLESDTVVSVRVNKPQKLIKDEELSSEEKKEIAEGLNINNATFNGQNILYTKVYQGLIINNYYISSMKWKSIINEKDLKGRVEILAQFNDFENGKEFVCKINGIHSKNPKTGEYSKYISPIKDKKNITMIMNNIIKTANKLYNELINEKKEDNDG
jgi:hypothetical protein